MVHFSGSSENLILQLNDLKIDTLAWHFQIRDENCVGGFEG